MYDFEYEKAGLGILQSSKNTTEDGALLCLLLLCKFWKVKNVEFLCKQKTYW